MRYPFNFIDFSLPEHSNRSICVRFAKRRMFSSAKADDQSMRAHIAANTFWLQRKSQPRGILSVRRGLANGDLWHIFPVPRTAQNRLKFGANRTSILVHRDHHAACVKRRFKAGLGAFEFKAHAVSVLQHNGVSTGSEGSGCL